MTMLYQTPLFQTAAALRSGLLDLNEYADQIYTRLERFDGEIESFVPASDRRGHWRQAAVDLQKRYPDPARRPPLYGVPIGVKDIYHVDGFVTQAGSTLPWEELVGKEASSVTKLKANGALILGKTVTAEFAYFEPGPTRNPRNLAHTPGGSSSGSAAAVAAGFCALALGTQTIGSVIRPAAYCGVVGFKPSYKRIARDGIIPVSDALDHVGMFTQDVAGMELAASLLCDSWRTLPEPDSLPRLAIPVGVYLEQASPEALDVFADHVRKLEAAGYSIQRVPLLDDFQAIREQTFRLMSAQMAEVHADWFARYEPLYRPRTATMIRNGQQVTREQQAADLKMQRETRERIAEAVQASDIDLWISPAATSAAPPGLQSTGNPAMNLPWTLIGFPTITLPTASVSADGLPFGLQVTGALNEDERLLQWSKRLSEAVSS